MRRERRQLRRRAIRGRPERAPWAARGPSRRRPCGRRSRATRRQRADRGHSELHDLVFLDTLGHEHREHDHRVETRLRRAEVDHSHRRARRIERRCSTERREDLVGLDVVRVLHDHAREQHQRMRLENPDQYLAVELVEVVQAQHHLRIARQESIQLRLVANQLARFGLRVERPTHVADGTDELEARRCRSRCRRALPRTTSCAATGNRRRGDSSPTASRSRCPRTSSDEMTGERLQRFRLVGVDEADAAIAGRDPGAHVRKQDVGALARTVEGAHVIAGTDVHAGKAQLDPCEARLFGARPCAVRPCASRSCVPRRLPGRPAWRTQQRPERRRARWYGTQTPRDRSRRSERSNSPERRRQLSCRRTPPEPERCRSRSEPHAPEVGGQPRGCGGDVDLHVDRDHPARSRRCTGFRSISAISGSSSAR